MDLSYSEFVLHKGTSEKGCGKPTEWSALHRVHDTLASAIWQWGNWALRTFHFVSEQGIYFERRLKSNFFRVFMEHLCRQSFIMPKKTYEFIAVHLAVHPPQVVATIYPLTLNRVRRNILLRTQRAHLFHGLHRFEAFFFSVPSMLNSIKCIKLLLSK